MMLTVIGFVTLLFVICFVAAELTFVGDKPSRRLARKLLFFAFLGYSALLGAYVAGASLYQLVHALVLLLTR